MDFNTLHFSLQKLNEMGAKKIGFIGIPPIGCVPSQRKHGSRECDPLRNQAAELFNSKIAKEIDRLNAERHIQDSRFAYGDIYYNVLDLIKRHGHYGECILYPQPLYMLSRSNKTILTDNYQHIINLLLSYAYKNLDEL
jgi:hypothetical protein